MSVDHGSVDVKTNDGRVLIYVGIALIVVGFGVGLASGISADSPKPDTLASPAEAGSGETLGSENNSKSERTQASAKDNLKDSKDGVPQEAKAADPISVVEEKVLGSTGEAMPAVIAGEVLTFAKCFEQVIESLPEKPPADSKCRLPTGDTHTTQQPCSLRRVRNDNGVDVWAHKDGGCSAVRCTSLVKTCGSQTDALDWLKVYGDDAPPTPANSRTPAKTPKNNSNR